MNQPKISVIIPMYNAKKYICDAVDSVLSQTFADCEVIVVDDCSTDGSYEFCQSQYANNPKVKLIHHEVNQGVAETRNTGLNKSNAKYVAFLDNDDVFAPYAMEVFYREAETHQADIVSSFGYMMSNDENIPRDFQGISRVCCEEQPVNEVKVYNYPPPTDCFQLKVDEFINLHFGWWCCWNKLYRREFLIENKIFFDKYVEDRLFTFDCFMNVQTYVKVPIICNVYRNIPVSSSRKVASEKHLKNSVDYFIRVAQAYDDYMNRFEFFKQNPELKYKVIATQLADCSKSVFMKYYLDSREVHGDVIKFANEQLEKHFGNKAPFVQWLFHNYHLMFRRLNGSEI